MDIGITYTFVNLNDSIDQPKGVHKIREVSFLPGGGLLKIGGIRYFFLDQEGIKRFFKLKRGIT